MKRKIGILVPSVLAFSIAGMFNCSIGWAAPYKSSVTPYSVYTSVAPVYTTAPVYAAGGTSSTSYKDAAVVPAAPAAPPITTPVAVPTSTQVVPSNTKYITPSELQALADLSLRFADELSPYGVRVTPNDVSSNNLTLDRNNSVRRKFGSGSMAFSADMLIRHDDYIDNSLLNAAGKSGEQVSSAFRFRIDADPSENVHAAVRAVLYGDTFGSNFGGGTNGSFLADPLTGKSYRDQNEIDIAYLKVKDFFKFGRDFYTHGSGLVMNDYVDSVQLSHKFGSGFTGAVNVFYDNDPADDSCGDPIRHVYNVNFDYNFNYNDIYVGYYNQDQKDTNNPKGRSFVELGAKGFFGDHRLLGYELGYVMNTSDMLVGGKQEGSMYHIAGSIDTGSRLKFKLAYTAADDEYRSAMALDFSQRMYDGIETPFDDIAYINGGAYSPMIPGSFTDAGLFKFQTEYFYSPKHYFRLAYDYYNQEAGIKAVGIEDTAGVLTLEYRWMFDDNCRFRTGFQTLSGSDYSADAKDDRLYMELFSKF